jgi:hypothetical protein
MKKNLMFAFLFSYYFLYKSLFFQKFFCRIFWNNTTDFRSGMSSNVTGWRRSRPPSKAMRSIAGGLECG